MHSAVLNEGRNCCMKSGIKRRAAAERRLTAELSDVGTDQAIGRMLIRACGRFRGSVDAFKAPSLPYHSVVWKNPPDRQRQACCPGLRPPRHRL